MAKRKRPTTDQDHARPSSAQRTATSQSATFTASRHLQLVTGSYDRTLHGIVATLKTKGDSIKLSEHPEAVFHDNFLFDAHGSAIRCLAISPVSDSALPKASSKIILATGGTDERVNLYQIDAMVPAEGELGLGLAGKSFENPKNKEVGFLLHHASSISALHFAGKSKLLTAAGDNTVAITRSKDWTVLSTIKAPVPQAAGRPSGDTAGPGETPSGVNDFAVHPSRKLMISVGKGERCMRLWNLITGKKAGVLNFERDLLQAVGEGRRGRGEGLKVAWNTRGDQFAVAFERGVAIFSMDSKARGVICPAPPTKIHQIRYISISPETPEHLAVSTEDGRVLIYSAQDEPSSSASPADAFPSLPLLGQVGGRTAGAPSRVKDFVILPDPLSSGEQDYIIVTGSSDGNIRVWGLKAADLFTSQADPASATGGANGKSSTSKEGDANTAEASSVPRIGSLLGEYKTSNRITCLQAFVMLEPDPSPAEDATNGGSAEDGEVANGSEEVALKDEVDDEGGEATHEDGLDTSNGNDASEDGFEGFD